jgi:hypothetical protein
LFICYSCPGNVKPEITGLNQAPVEFWSEESHQQTSGFVSGMLVSYRKLSRCPGCEVILPLCLFYEDIGYEGGKDILVLPAPYSTEGVQDKAMKL